MAQRFNQTKQTSNLKSTNIRKAGAVCTACAFIVFSSIGYASGVNTKTTDKNIYGVDYFMPFEPQTLYDILEKIPDANTALGTVAGTVEPAATEGSPAVLLLPALER